MSTITSGVTVPTALTFSGDTTGAITFQVSGTVTAATITSAGNVGIGTATPGAKLQIQSGTSPTQPTWAASDVVIAGNSAGNAAYYQSFSDSAGGLIFSTPTTRARSFLLWNENNGNSTWQNGSSGALVLNTNGAERMRVGGDGNVGIGTSGPVSKLQVLGARYTANAGYQGVGYLSSSDAFGADVGAGLILGGGYTSTLTTEFAQIAGVKENSTSGDYSGAMLLYTRTNGLGPLYERMRITSAGNVGIGVSTPAYAGMQLNTASGDSFLHITRTAQGTGGSDGFSIGLGADGNGYVFLRENSPLIFGTNNAERMRIDSSGNVGIGATPLSLSRLYVVGSDSTASNYSVIFRNSALSNVFYIQNDGLLSTGTAAGSPYYNTTGSGANVYVDSNGILFRSTSSLRYKSDVTDATHGLADVLKLRSVTYKGKNDGDTIFGGLIAEEVHDAGLTEFVKYDKEGRPDALNYGNMAALLTKAIQEQQAMIDELKAKVAALEMK